MLKFIFIEKAVVGGLYNDNVKLKLSTSLNNPELNRNRAAFFNQLWSRSHVRIAQSSGAGAPSKFALLQHPGQEYDNAKQQCWQSMEKCIPSRQEITKYSCASVVLLRKSCLVTSLELFLRAETIGQSTAYNSAHVKIVYAASQI